MSLVTLLSSKILKKIIPILDLLKELNKEETEPLIDISLSLLHRCCLSFSDLLRSDYLVSVINDFFGLEPVKNLYTISKLITVDGLRVSGNFLSYLSNIFLNSFKSIM